MPEQLFSASLLRNGKSANFQVMDFYLRISERIQGVFLVDAEVSAEEVGLSRGWERRESPHVGVGELAIAIDTDSWTLPDFLDLSLEHDFEYYGVEVDTEDTRVPKGVEIWQDLHLQVSYDAPVSAEEFFETLTLDYYFTTADHDPVHWWIVSEITAYGSTLEELEKNFAAGQADHLRALGE